MTRANLKKAFLRGANLQSANLQSARLDNADITDARLAKAQIDDTTSMENVKWWKADYYTGSDKSVDQVLLQFLYNRDGSSPLEHRAEAHASVQDFIRDQGLKKATTSDK